MKSRPSYPEELRRQMVALVRTGRTPEELSREFEPCRETIRNWVKQADLDDGRRHDGLTSEEKEELRRLRRENRVARLMRKAASGSEVQPHSGQLTATSSNARMGGSGPTGSTRT